MIGNTSNTLDNDPISPNGMQFAPQMSEIPRSEAQPERLIEEPVQPPRQVIAPVEQPPKPEPVPEPVVEEKPI